MGKHILKPKQMEAVRLVASGMKYADVAERLGVHENTVGNWMHNEDVQAEYVRQMNSIIKRSFTKAINKLDAQIESENEWISQGAAREIVGRYGAGIMGNDRQEIVVHISGGMPDVGVPDRSDVDE